MKRWSTYFLDKLQTRYILFIKNVINKMEHGLSNLFEDNIFLYSNNSTHKNLNIIFLIIQTTPKTINLPIKIMKQNLH